MNWIEEIRIRNQKRNQEEWTVEDASYMGYGGCNNELCVTGSYARIDGDQKDDAEFIANAPNDITRLLAAYEIALNGLYTALHGLEQTALPHVESVRECIKELENGDFELIAKDGLKVSEAEENNRTLEELELPVRLYMVLKRGGINLEKELLKLSLQDLSRFPNMGRKHLQILIKDLVPSWMGNTFSLFNDDTKKNIPLEYLIMILKKE